MQSGAADPARQPSIPIAPANFEPGLRSDPTGSFSDDVRPTRDGSYRAAQRGKRAESAGTAPDRGE
ncbi:MAG: hypothetical protein EXS13_10610 [Planctomycetes bacterium]|nr:hypothetical protein [Planctomycetota bacterium]